MLRRGGEGQKERKPPVREIAPSRLQNRYHAANTSVDYENLYRRVRQRRIERKREREKDTGRERERGGGERMREGEGERRRSAATRIARETEAGSERQIERLRGGGGGGGGGGGE
jgi:zinc finger CCCH domain-containing protein 13